MKETPAIYDNFTKLVGPHTMKLGFYWDSSGNKQSNSAADNGTYNLGGGSTSTTNTVADLVLGHIQNYQQQSSIPIQDIRFHQWSIYVQDSFKANKQLTLNIGLRFDHEGQWYGNPGGLQVWNPASYVNSTTAPANTGLLWNGINSKIPASGFVSPLFYYSPRVGWPTTLWETERLSFAPALASSGTRFPPRSVARAEVPWVRSNTRPNGLRRLCQRHPIHAPRLHHTKWQ